MNKLLFVRSKFSLSARCIKGARARQRLSLSCVAMLGQGAQSIVDSDKLVALPHFGGVTRCGSASLGRVGTGSGGSGGPYIQECHLVPDVSLHIRSFLAVVEEVWCF